MEQQQKAPKDIRAVADFLRSSKSGMKTRLGALNGKRVDYFKGKTAIKALLSPAYSKLKNAPPVSSEEDAIRVLNSVIPFAFYLRVQRPDASNPAAAQNGSSGGKGNPKVLSLTPTQSFASDGLYAWFYEGSQWTTYLGGLAMVALLLAGVMFPLWPPTLRLGVWYLSIGFLGLIGLFIAIAVLRLVFYVITVVAVPPGIWVFPKLFADVGVIESFIPFWEWDLPKKKRSKKARKEKEGDDSSSGLKSSKGKEKAKELVNGSSTSYLAEDVETSGDSRPVSRQAKVEDAPDED